MRRSVSNAAMAAAFVSLVTFAVQEVDARGARAGGASSMSRGGGGGGSGFSRGGNYSRPSGGTASQRPSGSGNRQGNTNVSGGNRTNINTGNVNTGDINVNRSVHVDNSLPHGYYGGWHDYPLARGVAIGAVAGMTAAAIGSAYYALPPACSPYVWQTHTYYACGSVYYRPQYQGDTIVYVVVDKPN